MRRRIRPSRQATRVGQRPWARRTRIPRRVPLARDMHGAPSARRSWSPP
jgi:hypothetical protein